jgi:hypothetical protein
MKFVFVLPLLLTCACADLGETPSLAPRPIETLGTASPPPAPPPAPVAADAALSQRIAALLDAARKGDVIFQREDRTNAAVIASGRHAAEGSDTWIAGEAAQSALITARQQTTDALTALDQLLIDQTAAGGGGLADIGNARNEVESLVARQTARLDASRP